MPRNHGAGWVGEIKAVRTGKPKGRKGKGPQKLGHVRWEGFSHKHMWNMIMRAQPDDVFRRHCDWNDIGRDLIGINKDIQVALNSLFQTWRGTASLTAALGNSQLLSWSQDSAEVTQVVGEELGCYGNALVDARKRMPQPRISNTERLFREGDGAVVPEGPENAFMLRQLLSDHLPSNKERRQAKADAVQVMRTFETEAVSVEHRLPTYSASPQVAPLTSPGPDGPVSPGPVPVPVPGGDPGTTTPGPLPLPLPGEPASTGAAGHSPMPGVDGPGAGRLAGGIGGVGGLSGLGTGAGADANYGGRVPGGGGPLTGAGPGGLGPGGAGAGQAGMAGAAAARGGGGGGFYPPMGGAGAGRDEEQEKRLASYIVADDDLFADDRPVSPPVFGA